MDFIGSGEQYITDGEGGMVPSGSCTRLKRVQNSGKGEVPPSLEWISVTLWWPSELSLAQSSLQKSLS